MYNKIMNTITFSFFLNFHALPVGYSTKNFFGQKLKQLFNLFPPETNFLSLPSDAKQ